MRVARLAVAASLIFVVLCSLTSLAMAQVTTATVRGSVKGADDGVPMAGAEVTLVDESTGSVKTATTNADGSFAFTNLQVGGPYHVTATVMGFKPAEEKDIFLTANKTRDVVLGLRLAEEVIEVSGTSIARTTSSRTVVTAAEIDALPSVGRDPRDLVRRNPEVSVEGKDRTLSIGGNNTRFNSITVDGIRQDDDFGLNASGYPTRRSPIALSAVQELTVESSPFDVHFGKFLGGNVNIVTKSGTNDFKGSLVGTYSSDSLLGSRTRDDRIKVDYSEVRYGGTVGGPIIKDKLHFLISAEGLNATTPVSVGPAESSATNKVGLVSQGDMEEAQRIARERYDFEAGVPARSLDEGDLKLLGKLDWAINKQHRASLIYQRTGGNSIQATGSSNTTLPLSSNWYDARDTLNTFSGRVFSDWSDQLSTQVEVNTKLVSSRVPPLNGNGFMSASIRACGENLKPTDTPFTCPAGTPTGTILLGPDEFRHVNTLDNDIFHTKAEANYLSGNHLLTVGAEYELLMIKNLFVPGSNGVVQYASLADFDAMKPSSIRYFNAIKTNPDGTTTLDPNAGAADWNSGTWTGYFQDQYKLTPEVTLQGGLRLEVYQTGDKIARNQNFVDRNGFDNTATLDGLKILMPRVGFSYLPVENLNLRGGIGLYSGGTPSVWVSNNYTNDGVRTSTVTCPSAACPGAMGTALITGFDGRNIPDGLAALVKQGNGNVDALDPDFKLPSSWKFGTGADYSLDIPGAGNLGKNIELKLNYTYSKTLHGVTWVDLRRDNLKLPNNDNNVPIGTTPDGRPLYANNFNVTRGYDMLLTNTSHGYGHVASVTVQKGFPFGLFVAGSYAYQDVHEVNPGTSSRSVSNYGLSAVGDPNDPSDAISNYQRKHRFTGAAEYSYPIASYFTGASPWKDMKSSVGMFIESRSGQPFSWTFGATEDSRIVSGRVVSDANGTKLGRIFGEDTTFSSRNRELFYVPIPGDRLCTQDMITTGCQVVLATGPNGITKEKFNEFLEKTGLLHYRGQVVPRNSSSSPWFTKIDMRFAQDLPNPLSGHRARFMLDLENVGNLLNHKWGRAQAVGFPFATPAVDLDYDRVNNRYVYSNLRSTNPSRVDVLQSVWRVSLGLQYDF